MVIACNTVCSVAYEELSAAYEMPVFEVVSAPARAAAAATKNGKIGVIGTAATIRSGAYETAIKNFEPGMQVFSESCPLFVPLAENGRTGVDDIAALAIAGDYLAGLRESGVDTLILGCTHYPLLRGVISKVMGQGVALIDSGAETAKLIADDLLGRDLLAPTGADGTIRYFVTDSIDGFSSLASRFLESEVHGMVEQIILE
jgi:glutamate racemase